MTFFKPIAYCLLPIAVFSLVACAPGKKELRPSETVPKADEIIKSLEISRERVKSLKGLANLKVVSGINSANVKEVIVAKRPGKLRLETIGLFGSPALIIATDGAMLTMHIPAENRFSRMELYSADLPFPLNFISAGDMAEMLLGATTLISYSASRIDYSDDGNYILTLGSSDGLKKQVIALEPGTLRLLRSDIKDDERGVAVSFSYSDYQDVSGMQFPKEVRAESFPGPGSLIIRYEDIELNQEIDDDLFVLSPPAISNEYQQ